MAEFNSVGNGVATKAAAQSFLQLWHWPARFDISQVAIVLGFKEHEIGVLIHYGKIPVLGKPAKNGPKFFARSIIEELADDPEWLGKATMTITAHWQKKNRLQLSEQMAPAAV